MEGRGEPSDRLDLPIMVANADKLRVAIIGSGPAGFYAAGQLLSHREVECAVDLYDRLPTPWGLVRAGVAPDHPKIKSVSRVYEKTAAQAGFRFFGNVEVGRDVSHEQLLEHYDAVLYAIGTAGDRRLGIPGEDLPGSHAATAFVAWYNGHPDYCDREFDLSVRRAVVIGNGNVAIDVARMLALSPAELAVTDIADHALDALRDSSVEEIVVLGRRGPAQAAFTNPELRELADLTDADVVVDPSEAQLDPASADWIKSDAADITSKRNVETLAQYAERGPSGKPKRIVLRFLASPVEIVGTDRVAGVVIEHNELVAREDGSMRARATGTRETIEAGLVMRSIGYVGSPLAGVPFDQGRSTILNEHGRVIDPGTGGPLPGAYVAGWIKRGPSGVIGTNKKDAQETTRLLLEDHAAGLLPTRAHDPDELIAHLRGRGTAIVEYEGWQAIDEHERAAGEPYSRPRVKLVRHAHLLERAAAQSSLPRSS
jgi:ferredoxin--NADP+ reductase